MTTHALKTVGSGMSLGALLALAAVQPLEAQMGGGVIAYPAAGQSQQQQQKDQYECHSWAMQQTGVDPTQGPPRAQQAYADPPPSRGSSGFLGVGGDRNLLGGEGGTLSDAATGAGIGAIGGAIAGDAAAGAIIGAASSAIFGGIARSSREQEQRDWERQQQQRTQQQNAQAQARWQEQMNGYRRAFSVCMSSRDYRVQ